MYVFRKLPIHRFLKTLMNDLMQGMADYAALTGVPKWAGNYPVGHLGTYAEPEGGAFGDAAVKWLQWVLKGDTSQANWFAGGGAQEDGWEEVDSERLEDLLTFAGV